jgi:hypothetical protein
LTFQLSFAGRLHDISPGAKKGETNRQAGLVLIVFIDYTNRLTSINELSYTYKAFAVAGAENKKFHLDISSDGSNVTEFNRHGIRIVFVPTGTLHF